MIVFMVMVVVWEEEKNAWTPAQLPGWVEWSKFVSKQSSLCKLILEHWAFVQLIIAQLIMRREDTRLQVKMAKKERETKWIILKVYEYQNNLFIYSKQEYWAESYICSPWE